MARTEKGMWALFNRSKDKKVLVAFKGGRAPTEYTVLFTGKLAGKKTVTLQRTPPESVTHEHFVSDMSEVMSKK